jgi:MFS family permease
MTAVADIAAMTATGSQPDPRRWKALGLLCLANLMVILDAQIVILGLPSIEADLGLSAGNAQWVMSAYLLSFGGLLLLGGRSADLLGRRRMFIVGTGLFLFSSLACGLAWSGAVLIAARVVQGVSAAIMAPTALSILMTTFEEGAERNKALGVWSAVGGTGATAALLIGGPLTDGPGWEWIFLINIPVAAALIALAPRFLRESHGAAGGGVSDRRRARLRRGHDGGGLPGLGELARRPHRRLPVGVRRRGDRRRHRLHRRDLALEGASSADGRPTGRDRCVTRLTLTTRRQP